MSINITLVHQREFQVNSVIRLESYSMSRPCWKKVFWKCTINGVYLNEYREATIQTNPSEGSILIRSTDLCFSPCCVYFTPIEIHRWDGEIRPTSIEIFLDKWESWRKSSLAARDVHRGSCSAINSRNVAETPPERSVLRIEFPTLGICELWREICSGVFWNF